MSSKNPIKKELKLYNWEICDVTNLCNEKCNSKYVIKKEHIFYWISRKKKHKSHPHLYSIYHFIAVPYFNIKKKRMQNTDGA